MSPLFYVVVVVAVHNNALTRAYSSYYIIIACFSGIFYYTVAALIFHSDISNLVCFVMFLFIITLKMSAPESSSGTLSSQICPSVFVSLSRQKNS